MAVPNIEGWSDFERWVDEYIPKLTLEKYRVLSDRFETLRNQYVSKTPPRKVLFTARIQSAFRDLRASNDFQTYKILRQELEATTPYHSRSAYAPAQHYHQPPVPNPPHFGNGSYRPPGWTPGFAATQAAMNRPFISGQQPSPVASTSASTSKSAVQLADWKASPMWKPIRALTHMEHLPDITEKETNSTRRFKRVPFTLPSDVIERLSRPPSQTPRHAIRLFCTTSEYFRPVAAYGQPSLSRNIPIEYPSQPEVLYDDSLVTFTAKGLRGKAGSAPPLDIGTCRRGLNLQPGRVTTIQFAHTGPTLKKQQGPAKRFFFQLVLCEVTSRDELFGMLQRQPPRPPSVTIAALKGKMADEDDIIVGSSKMMLKDPLAYMRIALPVRSTKCPHVQCFDAYWWLESNVNTPQFLCPLCTKEMKWNELFVDGYSTDILQSCPEDIDEVTIEPDGNWHTDDNKYGSAEWLASVPPPVKPQPQSRRSSIPPPPTEGRSPTSEDKGKTKASVVVLSSDDETDVDSDVPLANGRVLDRGASSSQAPAARPHGQQEVIDLTFDSDEEDEQPLATANQNGTNGHNGNHNASYADAQAASLKQLEADMERELAAAQMSLKRKESSEGQMEPDKRQRNDYGMGYR